MAAIALVALRRGKLPWYRDGSAVVLCLTGCAMVAFIPPAFFDGISTTRHMVGMNLSTVLAIPVCIGLAASMLTGWRRSRGGQAGADLAEPAQQQVPAADVDRNGQLEVAR